MAEIYDKRIPYWQVGDKVFLSAYRGDQSARIRFPGLGPSKALSPARLGPYPVIGKVGMNAYRLDLPRSVKIHPVINARYLTLARESRFYPDHRGDSVAENPPAFYDEEFKEDLVYEVENILHKRVRGKPGRGLRTEYLIKWKGYEIDDATWEPPSNLKGCTKLIREFEQIILNKSDTNMLHRTIAPPEDDLSGIVISVMYV